MEEVKFGIGHGIFAPEMLMNRSSSDLTLEVNQTTHKLINSMQAIVAGQSCKTVVE